MRHGVVRGRAAPHTGFISRASWFVPWARAGAATATPRARAVIRPTLAPAAIRKRARFTATVLPLAPGLYTHSAVARLQNVTKSSDSFEVPAALPVGDGGFEGRLLGAGEVDVVV